MTDTDEEALNLAATDVLNAAKDIFDLYDAYGDDLHAFEIRRANDGTVSIWLPDGKILWAPKEGAA